MRCQFSGFTSLYVTFLHLFKGLNLFRNFISHRTSAPRKLMKKEKSNGVMINTVPVVLAVLEKMTMSGWLMTPWQWPITMTLLMMTQTVSSILTSLTLSLSPATVLLPRHGPDWWEFIQRPIRPSQADLFGGIYSTSTICISPVIDELRYQIFKVEYQEYHHSGE